MIKPTDQWTAFQTDADQLEYLKTHGLASKKADAPKQLWYDGVYTTVKVPCQVVGYASDNCAVIKVGDKLHCIDPAYLAEMQRHTNKLKRAANDDPSKIMIGDDL